MSEQPVDVVIHLPAISDDQISNDLVWLTERLAKGGAEISGGFLGGEYGYGAYFENETFMMHPFCWCDRDDCAWCWGCLCPDDADIYEIAGRRVEFEEWLDEYSRTGNTKRVYRKDESLACDYCRGERVSAPNFLHKPSGTAVHWYKYIGRSMEVDLRGDWRAVLSDCVASLP